MATSIMSARSIGTAVNPGGTNIGSGGGTFKIKVARYIIASSAPLEDVTGDGDAGMTTVEAMPTDRVTLNGFCVSANAIGLAALGGGAKAIELLLEAGRKVTGDLMVGNIQVNWQRTRGSIPLAIAGTIQNRLVEGTA